MQVQFLHPSPEPTIKQSPMNDKPKQKSLRDTNPDYSEIWMSGFRECEAQMQDTHEWQLGHRVMEVIEKRLSEFEEQLD